MAMTYSRVLRLAVIIITFLLTEVAVLSDGSFAADTRPRDSSGWVTCSASFTPLSDAAAAALVVPMTENRSWSNANGNSVVGDANHYRPSSGEITAFLNNERDVYGQLPAEFNPYLQYVTGGFTGATDDIIQWGAAKWGIAVDWLRAEYVQESNWNMTQLGDIATVGNVNNYPAFSRINSTQVHQSLGITQLKWNHPDGNNTGIGTEPLRWKSTAFNVDYQLAMVRFYFDNPQNRRSAWGDGSYTSCNNWLSIGGWFTSYPWNNASQNDYVNKVKAILINQTWAQCEFPPARIR